jgi:hypothetical protein
MQKDMNLKEIEEYLGIIDNEDYLYKKRIINHFKELVKEISFIENEKVEIILQEDYYHLKLDYDIIYQFKEFIVYKTEHTIQNKYEKMILEMANEISKLRFDNDLEWGEYAAEENYKIENIIKEYEEE